MLRFLAFLSLALCLLPGAQAQSGRWPDKPITLVVPFPVGGSTDGTARTFADAVSKSLGQPVVVENRVGASGQVALSTAAKAKPDGYTFVMATGPIMGLLPHVRKTGYDPFADFVPVSRFADSLLVVAVNGQLPVNTLAEFIDYAKARPQKLFFGSTGLSTNRMSVEFLQQRGSFKLTHVPYKGEPDGLMALLAGDIQLMVLATGQIMQHVRSGKIKVLAIMDNERFEDMPGVPAITEVIPDFSVFGGFGMIAPAGTPMPIVEAMAAEINKVARLPEVRAKLKGIGAKPRDGTPAALAAQVRSDHELFGKLVSTLGIKE
ncbi:MAG: tripartite tricarboxylate transporter substrate binding protein [Burkholderiaceae bacterium]|nr:tripartite tricarboxylate transporter substrate binding protein [Burkholderiaceae bacterium]